MTPSEGLIRRTTGRLTYLHPALNFPCHAATNVKELPLYSRLLLAVLLEETKEGHVLRWSDLKSQFTDAVSQKLAGKCGNNVFENQMQVLLEYSLAAVHKGHARQTQDASVTAMISIDDYLKHVTSGDNQLFDRYLASIRKSHQAKMVQGTG